MHRCWFRPRRSHCLSKLDRLHGRALLGFLVRIRDGHTLVLLRQAWVVSDRLCWPILPQMLSSACLGCGHLKYDSLDTGAAFPHQGVRGTPPAIQTSSAFDFETVMDCLHSPRTGVLPNMSLPLQAVTRRRINYKKLSLYDIAGGPGENKYKIQIYSCWFTADLSSTINQSTLSSYEVFLLSRIHIYHLKRAVSCSK